jgi:cytoskeletal protein CcmA (bactofilin family)
MGLFNRTKPEDSNNIPQPSATSIAKPMDIPASEPVKAIPTTNNTNNFTAKMNNTIISTGSVLEGQIKVDGEVLVDGLIKGTVHSKGKVVIGANGKVEGDVICQEAEISGRVSGKIQVKEILFLKGNAQIDGDIHTGKLVMENGVQFNGKCHMGGTAPANNGSISNSGNGLANAASANGTTVNAQPVSAHGAQG